MFLLDFFAFFAYFKGIQDLTNLWDIFNLKIKDQLINSKNLFISYIASLIILPASSYFQPHACIKNEEAKSKENACNSSSLFQIKLFNCYKIMARIMFTYSTS